MSIRHYRVHGDIELLLHVLAQEDGIDPINWVNTELTTLRQASMQGVLAPLNAEEVRIISAPRSIHIECFIEQLNIGTLGRLMVEFNLDAESIIVLAIYRGDIIRHGTVGQRHRCSRQNCRE